MSSSPFAVVASLSLWSILLWTTNRCITSATTSTTGSHHPIWLASSSSASASAYRPQQQDRYTNQLLLKKLNVHLNHQRHLLRAWPPPPPQHSRILQNDTAAAAPALCNDTTGSINFPDVDGLNFQLFGGTPSDLYESLCFCEEGRLLARNL